MTLIYEVASFSITVIYAPILFWVIRSIEQLRAELNEHIKNSKTESDDD